MKNEIKNYAIDFIEKMQIWRIRKIYRNRIREIQKSLGIEKCKLEVYEKEKIISVWSKLASKFDMGWHNWYKNITGVFDERFVPEDLFYSIIVPRLSPPLYSEVYADKGNYDLILPGIPQPKCVVKNINGSYYSGSRSLLTKHEAVDKVVAEAKRFVIKPTVNTSQGQNVRLVKFDSNVNNDRGEYINDLFIKYNTNFIVQEAIIQADETARFHPDSLNTMRIISLFLNNKVSVLSAVLRMGMSGSVIDNFTAGGIAVGLKPDGYLSSCGIDIKWQQYKQSSTGIRFEGEKVSGYPNIVGLIDGYHKMMPNCRLISWDFAIDRDNSPILIEVNLAFQELNFHQFHNGALFKDRTDEVIEFVKSNKVNWFNLK